MKMHWGRRPGAPAALPTGGAERAARMRHFHFRGERSSAPEDPTLVEGPLASEPVAAAFLRRVRGNDFVRHGALVFGSSMLVSVCGFLYHAGVSRGLGVEDYGALYALLAILPLAGLPAGIISTVIVKFAAEFQALGDEAHIHALVAKVSLGMGALGVVFVGAAVVFERAIAGFLHVPGYAVVPTALLLLVVLLLPALRAVLQGTQDFVRFAVSSTIEGVLKAALGVAFVFAGYGLLGALGGWTLGSFTSLGYTWFVLRRRYSRTASGDLHLDWQRIAQTLWGAAVAAIAATVLSYGDVLLVKHFMSAREAGLYASVSLGGKILLFVAGFVPMVLLPKAAHRSTSGRSPFPIFLAAMATLAAFSLAGLALFYVAPSLVLRSLVGGQFLAASHLLFGYGLAMVFLAGMGLVANYKIALHRFDFAIPFCLVTAGELVAIAVHHPSLGAVIAILITGNALGFAASLYRIAAWRA